MFSTLREALDHNRQTQNPYLDLGNLGLTGNEPELEELKDFEWVETLIFSDNYSQFYGQENIYFECVFLEYETPITYYNSKNKGAKNVIYSLPPCLPKKIKELVLNTNDINDVIFLKGLINLNYLDMNDNPSLFLDFCLVPDCNDDENILIIDTPFSHDLSNLTHLKLFWCEIKNTLFLEKLHNLRVLYIPDNLIDNVICLQSLTELIYLDISSNKIIDIFPLQRLNKLTHIAISNNKIIDISALQNNNDLIHLHLDHNEITDISPLYNLKNLVALNISYNKIKNISYLSNLLNLTYFKPKRKSNLRYFFRIFE